jgi:hypothetical protein
MIVAVIRLYGTFFTYLIMLINPLIFISPLLPDWPMNLLALSKRLAQYIPIDIINK